MFKWKARRPAAKQISFGAGGFAGSVFVDCACSGLYWTAAEPRDTANHEHVYANGNRHGDDDSDHDHDGHVDANDHSNAADHTDENAECDADEHAERDAQPDANVNPDGDADSDANVYANTDFSWRSFDNSSTGGAGPLGFRGRA